MAACGATIEALESLYRADLPRVVRAAAAIVGDEGEGRDAVQEAFAQAVRKWTTFNGAAPKTLASTSVVPEPEKGS
jgi:DNA-directed RNA polymerase specialized sigma24 family protein